MQKLFVGAVLALAVAALLPRPASAGIWDNGIWENGIWENGIWENGIWENGIWSNGIWSNGSTLQGYRFDGIVSTRRESLKGHGLRLDGASAGGHHLAGPQCTARRVDFSAVPLANVTVRLPRAR